MKGETSPLTLVFAFHHFYKLARSKAILIRFDTLTLLFKEFNLLGVMRGISCSPIFEI